MSPAAGGDGGPGILRPNWPAPPRVRAAFSLRSGGVSVPPWDSLNLGAHVGDDPPSVRENRRRLREALSLPAEPRWLEQVHGVAVSRDHAAATPPIADAFVTDRPGVVAAIMVADCIPVLFCEREGRVVAAAHAGWRGLAAGVLENTVAAMGVDPGRLVAWMGPAIGPDAFEVGSEVRAAFVEAACGEGAAARFRPSPAGRWLCDLTGLARDRLARLGVGQVCGGGLCTASDPGRFYSHRRDALRTGRMAALVWLEP